MSAQQILTARLLYSGIKWITIGKQHMFFIMACSWWATRNLVNA